MLFLAEIVKVAEAPMGWPEAFAIVGGLTAAAWFMTTLIKRM